MQLRVFTEPQQGASYQTLLAVAREAERLGYDGWFQSDHYLRIWDSDPLPGPTDAWTTLAGLARDTERLRLGTLLTSATFRLPGVLAIATAYVDAMSGGRVELGLGAGWYSEEHKAYGIPFPGTKERFERLEEQLQVITGLWATPVGETFSFEGDHYRLVDSPALPKPMQDPRPPIIVGGHGPKRTPRIAARFADEHNVPFSPLEQWTALRDAVTDACEEIGRDPAEVTRSVALVLCCGNDEAEVERRAAAIGISAGDLRDNGAAGTVQEVVDKLATYADAGCTRVYLQMRDLHDLEHLALVAEEVAPALS